jgi:hypothetical protein
MTPSALYADPETIPGFFMVKAFFPGLDGDFPQ